LAEQDDRLDPEAMLAMTIRLGEGFVREGLLPLDQLSDEEVGREILGSDLEVFQG
jgi:hypothetical protein